MSEEKKQVSEQNFSPGNVLRAQREEYEWSVEAVAEALHLSTHSVKAIEADRYDDLPGATYVIGYWRSYARLLGIDIEETIEVNKRNLQVVTAEPSGMDINRLMHDRKHGGGLGWFILLIILGGAGYFAWQQQFFGLLEVINVSDTEKSSEAQVQESVEVLGSAEQSAKQKQAQVLRPLTAKPTLEEGRAAGADIVSDERSSNQEVMTREQNGLVLTPAANANQGQNVLQAQTGVQATSTTPILPNTSSSASAANSAPVIEKSPAVIPVSPPKEASGLANAGISANSMVLTLSKDSWLDIRDKTNKRLLYKTETAGQTIEVKGMPPFYVYIGTPDGVSVRYQGKNVPFETHKSGLFARFKLGAGTLEAL